MPEGSKNAGLDSVAVAVGTIDLSSSNVELIGTSTVSYKDNVSYC